MTMRELLDVLKMASEEERREFSEWWGNLPLPAPSATVVRAKNIEDFEKLVSPRQTA